jgi:hypothetical protein
MADVMSFWVSVGVVSVLIVAVLAVTYGVPSGLWRRGSWSRRSPQIDSQDRE